MPRSDSSVLSLRGVTKVYNMGATEVRALDGIDLDLQEGDFVAILGPSGSGKSTLMHLLGFLDTPTSGEIWLRNRKLSHLTPNERACIRAEEIGFVFQSFNLLPRLDVVQNVLLPLTYNRRAKAQDRSRVWPLLEAVGMKERAHHRPNQLSGGQRQRVAIARAMINEPALVLADEPTGNLDSSTARTILELFRHLNDEGRTIILVTHDTQVASYAKRRVEVLDGRIVAIG